MSLERWLAELDERNVDNVTRTDSYLELYRWTVEQGTDLPWVLMAHLVSRNAGYLMTDLRRAIDRNAVPGIEAAATNLFEMLERANWLIFHDAWHHVLRALIDGPDGLEPGRTTAWVRDAWRRHFDAPDERTLVLDLVVNEQNLIERRAVHHERFGLARMMLAAVEGSGREKPISLPGTDSEIRVGDFASLDARIEAGRRIYDEVLADRGTRDTLYRWALDHPHTGSREVIGGRPGPTLREAWPVVAHPPMEPDPLFP